MNKLKALTALRDKVKEGALIPDNLIVSQEVSEMIDLAVNVSDLHGDVWADLLNAYDGSLDAAKALHDAVLPGWFWSIDSEDCGVCLYTHLLDDAVLGADDNPARAWLIAILEALIAQETGQ
jgi:hypothetical protein